MGWVGLNRKIGTGYLRVESVILHAHVMYQYTLDSHLQFTINLTGCQEAIKSVIGETSFKVHKKTNGKNKISQIPVVTKNSIAKNLSQSKTLARNHIIAIWQNDLIVFGVFHFAYSCAMDICTFRNLPVIRFPKEFVKSTI